MERVFHADDVSFGERLVIRVYRFLPSKASEIRVIHEGIAGSELYILEG